MHDFRVPGFGCSGLGITVPGFGFRVQGSGFSGSRVAGFRVQGLVSSVLGSVFSVFGLRVWGLGLAGGTHTELGIRVMGIQGYLAHKKQLPPLGPT